ncbi:energy-coupling factor ABC transporter ATP-binding protein [Gracilibacillus kekensis]|uniref:Energy-coupling factor transporter ATP-binding protein EcfA2 n=1 Tax=Gracilibacillus kekensis TaxID=1027249 RepID=A0A1M7QX99_9BACI|nr:energy-coupling factor ABC transporter ATP-binding protein [Gracilibacillus kekensis]SHN36686.1 energy-coupling factor transport system ATP-binding protein [Gracilibacillus kekensis]
MDIQFKQVSYTYQPHTPFAYQAIRNINLSISSGEYIAIVGHTGSGKSTLLQHINGLLLPTDGEVQIGEYILSSNNKRQDLRKLREKVGIVFQYPEHQLFEETVEKDISFGPHNFGIPKDEISKRVLSSIEKVELQTNFLEKSPFELSGGQMRRVAIAGVLAMEPEVLILDEPTAGLDPKGQIDIMKMFYQLHQSKQMTTILVTHQMDHALKYADRIIVLANGEVYMEGNPEEIFSKTNQLQEVNLDVPEILTLIQDFNQRFNGTIRYQRQSIAELAKEIVEHFRENKRL